MRRWIGLLLPLCLLLAGCAGAADPLPALPEAEQPGPAPAGELRLMYAVGPDVPDCLADDGEAAVCLAANTLDTLTVFDARGLLCPGLAEKWSYDSSDRTWTLKLREDAVWVDAEGRAVSPVTAGDFVAAARYILTPENDSPAASELRALLENAEAYYDGLDPEKEDEPIDFAEVGVHAADEHTLRYTLKKAAPNFPARLTGRAFLPTPADRPEDKALPWSCGPFYLAAHDSVVGSLLRKNPHFRDADSVSIETVRLLYDPDAAVRAPALAAEGALGWAPLDDEAAEAWLADPARAASVSREAPDPTRSYFLCFNFNVRALDADYSRGDAAGWSLDERYEPENWERAVNCEAFRQSVRHAVDRAALWGGAAVGNTITPARFAADPRTGADYTVLGSLPELGDPYSPELAREFRDAAVAELTGQGCAFPVKTLVRCPEDDEKALARCERLAGQLESVLGADYIDVIVETAPAENYWTLVRRGCGYMLLECFWDADSPDPDTWTRPFFQQREPDGKYGRGYRYAYLACAVTDGTPSADAVREYFALVEKARAQTRTSVRLASFAEAEALLIDRALALPLGTGKPARAVSRLDRSGCPSLGLARASFQYARLLDRPVTLEESVAAAAAPEPPEPTPEPKANSVVSDKYD